MQPRSFPFIEARLRISRRLGDFAINILKRSGEAVEEIQGLVLSVLQLRVLELVLVPLVLSPLALAPLTLAPLTLAPLVLVPVGIHIATGSDNEVRSYRTFRDALRADKDKLQGEIDEYRRRLATAENEIARLRTQQAVPEVQRPETSPSLGMRESVDDRDDGGIGFPIQVSSGPTSDDDPTESESSRSSEPLRPAANDSPDIPETPMKHRTPPPSHRVPSSLRLRRGETKETRGSWYNSIIQIDLPTQVRKMRKRSAPIRIWARFGKRNRP
ncbi:hypothetical protein CFIO01_11714 [Colletotrichum fioriniae PJ7]|uniref:Uncharacterized protein n=1 Tax=Colletotrichum fioriniae PJ7 TaxID=1445577 RepID=A0A010RDW3_9PEZI|nr:hypothetical protein CFIO01_11714 [Colletotrichum fioriniae PJ7]